MDPNQPQLLPCTSRTQMTQGLTPLSPSHSTILRVWSIANPESQIMVNYKRKAGQKPARLVHGARLPSLTSRRHPYNPTGLSQHLEGSHQLCWRDRDIPKLGAISYETIS